MFNVYLVEIIAGQSIEEIHNSGKAVVGEGGPAEYIVF